MLRTKTRVDERVLFSFLGFKECQCSEQLRFKIGDKVRARVGKDMAEARSSRDQPRFAEVRRGSPRFAERYFERSETAWPRRLLRPPRAELAGRERRLFTAAAA